MRRLVAAMLCAVLLTAMVAPEVGAAVNVNRSGDENPLKEVAKSVIWGGLAGLTVGSALAVASKDNHNDEDLVRWGFASGTLLGLGVGLYWVFARPSPTAALEFQNGQWSAGAPSLALGPDGRARVQIVRVRF
jgi:hypothetical protein